MLHTLSTANSPLLDYPGLSKFQNASPIPKGMVGFYEKYTVSPDTKIAAIGDIHGNFERLQQTLQELKKRGFFYEDYTCTPGHMVVFLGDYVDRGTKNLQVVERLIELREKNKTTVILVRGNHEDLEVNVSPCYSAEDSEYRQFLGLQEGQQCLGHFYESCPLIVYIGTPGNYRQFVHGLFNLRSDPNPLFLNPAENATLWVDDPMTFSDRVLRLMQTKDPSALKVMQAVKEIITEHNKRVFWENTFWLDVSTRNIKIDPITGRIALPPDVIQAYLKTSGPVTGIIRGHQGDIFDVQYEGSIICSTIDPSKMDQQVWLEYTVGEWRRETVTLEEESFDVPLLNPAPPKKFSSPNWYSYIIGGGLNWGNSNRLKQDFALALATIVDQKVEYAYKTPRGVGKIAFTFSIPDNAEFDVEVTLQRNKAPEWTLITAQ